MPRFQIGTGRFGRYPTAVLTDSATGACAEIMLEGALLLSYRVPLNGALFDITDGFATPEEHAARKGGRAIIMAPFSNRVRNADYTFGGTLYRLPSQSPDRRQNLHGFARDLEFAPEAAADDAAARADFASSAIRPGFMEGYPFAIDLVVSFALTAHGLRVAIRGRNVGKAPAPFASGWHPYFRTGTRGIDHLQLAVPCRQGIVTDGDLIPLEGKAAYRPIREDRELDFRPRRGGKARTLGATVIDSAFARLVPDSDGWIRTWIHDPENGVRIAVFQDQGLMHVFTGDPLPTRPRASLALEPVMVMTNAFNRPECERAITLKPGRSSTFRFGVQAEDSSWR